MFPLITINVNSFDNAYELLKHLSAEIERVYGPSSVAEFDSDLSIADICSYRELVCYLQKVCTLAY